MRGRLFYVMVLLVCFCHGFRGKTKSPAYASFSISGLAQGTTYHITYYAFDSLVSKKQIDSVLDKLDSSLSIYKSYSTISRFNGSEKGAIMDAHLSRVMLKSFEIYKETHGMSDPTIYPLMEIWGFRPANPHARPDSTAILAALNCVGASKLHIKGQQLLKDRPCMKIDLNGIAQGYSVDVLADFLLSKGIRNFIAEIGGELRVKGRKQPGNTQMTVGIESPAKNRSAEAVVSRTMMVGDCAITTSGNYRNYHEQNGRRLSHLMNPMTGYPFSNELISVTVLTDMAITADGYDNALMGMGLKGALAFLRKKKELEAYFIYRDLNGNPRDTATPGFPKEIKINLASNAD